MLTIAFLYKLRNGLGEKELCIIVLQILLKKLNWINY